MRKYLSPLAINAIGGIMIIVAVGFGSFYLSNFFWEEKYEILMQKYHSLEKKAAEVEKENKSLKNDLSWWEGRQFEEKNPERGKGER